MVRRAAPHLNQKDWRVFLDIGYSLRARSEPLEKILVLGVPKEGKKTYMEIFKQLKLIVENDGMYKLSRLGYSKFENLQKNAERTVCVGY
ncbi:MAG: hypothetical protein V1678_01340 [Candidatus Aenigmatarchaeota archaeon]